jgi:hypothetical protein
MILFEWDAQKENVRTPVCFRILSSSLTSVSIFSVWCYFSVYISVVVFHLSFHFLCLLLLYSTEYIFFCKRTILFLSSSKAGVHTRRAERGMGGSIFLKTREIGLPSYSKICTLCSVVCISVFRTLVPYCRA